MKWVTFLKEDPNGLYQPGETRYLNDDAAKKYLDKNIAVIHGWKCLRCGEGPIEQEKKPKICPNPNCQSKTFKAFHPIEHDEVAQAIYQNIPIVAAEDNGELWIYQNEGENKGVYSNDIAESVIKEKIKDLKPGCKQHFRNEVLDYIRIENYISRKKLGLSERKIAVKNGILDLESRELEEFGPEKYVISKIPVKYDPDAECPEIKKFIESLVGNGKDVNKIVEMIGYSLLRENPLNKAFMGLGPGENGRSTLFNLIQEFLGIKNVAGVDLTDLIYDRFASADLYGKLANMCADISDRKIKHSGRFKKQVGEDLIRAQHKNQDAFHFKNYATPWFSANELPETTDKTRSFYRRWVIINFPYTFTSDPEELEKEGYKEKNSDLPDSIITDKELSGLLNWALNCLENVLGNKRFTNERTIEEKRELWELESDPVLEFIDTWCIEDKKKGEEIPKDVIRQAYRKFCIENNYNQIAQSELTKRLKAHGVQTSRPRVEVDGEKTRVRCYKGITLKPETIQNKDLVHLVQGAFNSFYERELDLDNSKKQKDSDSVHPDQKVLEDSPTTDRSQLDKVRALKTVKESLKAESDYTRETLIKEAESEGLTRKFVEESLKRGVV